MFASEGSSAVWFARIALRAEELAEAISSFPAMSEMLKSIRYFARSVCRPTYPRLTLIPPLLNNSYKYSEAVHREATYSEAVHREATYSEAVHREATYSEAVHSEAVFQRPREKLTINLAGIFGLSCSNFGITGLEFELKLVTRTTSTETGTPYHENVKYIPRTTYLKDHYTYTSL